MTLRDELAVVLGPGNDDATAYAQADSVLEVLSHSHPDHAPQPLHAAVDQVWADLTGGADGSLIVTSDEADDAVLEQLQDLTHDELRRGLFALRIVALLTNVERTRR